MASPRNQRKEKNNDNGFLAGPIVPALLRFAVPVLFALLLQNFYGAFDLWAVGRFCGSAEVSAVSTVPTYCPSRMTVMRSVICFSSSMR